MSIDVRVQVPSLAPPLLMGAGKREYARVVELADSLDSGSSAHYGRAGSSPASRTKPIPQEAAASCGDPLEWWTP